MLVDFRTTYLSDSSGILIGVSKFLELRELSISVVCLYPENKVVIDTAEKMYYPWPASIELYKALWERANPGGKRAIRQQVLRSKALITDLKEDKVSEAGKVWHMSVVLGSAA